MVMENLERSWQKSWNLKSSKEYGPCQSLLNLQGFALRKISGSPSGSQAFKLGCRGLKDGRPNQIIKWMASFLYHFSGLRGTSGFEQLVSAVDSTHVLVVVSNTGWLCLALISVSPVRPVHH